jgi:tRNA(Leu) C34 or U34 (ribose-2'-O)-methylase TrmL
LCSHRRNLAFSWQTGFSIDDRYLKRAGLDYWDKVDLLQWDSLEQLQQQPWPDASGI